MAASSESRHYLCKACGTTRSKKSLILAHMQLCYPQDPSFFSTTGKDIRRYICKICGCSRSKLSIYRKHMQTHLPIERGTDCSTDGGTDCGTDEGADRATDGGTDGETDGRTSVTQSEETKKRKRLLECNICGFETKKPSHMQQHMISHSNELYIWCTRAVLWRVTSLEVLVTRGIFKSGNSLVPKRDVESLTSDRTT